MNVAGFMNLEMINCAQSASSASAQRVDGYLMQSLNAEMKNAEYSHKLIKEDCLKNDDDEEEDSEDCDCSMDDNENDEDDEDENDDEKNNDKSNNNNNNENNEKNDRDEEDDDLTLDEKMLDEIDKLRFENCQETSDNFNEQEMNSIEHLKSQSMPQISYQSLEKSLQHFIDKELNVEDCADVNGGRVNHENAREHNNERKMLNNMQHRKNSSPFKKKENRETQKKKIEDLLNEFKLNPFNFHSLDTFGRFIRNSLNLKSELVNDIVSNPRIQYWIDKNKTNGFVYQTYPRIDETKRRVPPVRCELCKFYGHLSHTCSIKELAFKLNNVALRSGACRCHICGQLGHPAEAGLCPYIACSFCSQNGHWNYMCPNKDKISRTLCFKCQRYGHNTERCPDQWRQFDRISTFEQTPQKDPNENKKPVYCYQCAQKGHYGHNCPDFYRKYFIRDYHQLDTHPVYFFAASSPFVKHSVPFNEPDKKIVDYLVDKPLDDRYGTSSYEQDPLEQLEKFQEKNRCENRPNPTTFDEAHPNMPLKEYIRKWSNWVIDFHWIFTLKYFIEFLPTNKLHFFIKNYPSLDNFILHWMWWSYSLNKDLERFTKDPFRAIGSTPWLSDDLTSDHAKNLHLNKPETKKNSKIPKQPSKFFQYNEFTIKTIGSLLFQHENKQKKSNNNNQNHRKNASTHNTNNNNSTKKKRSSNGMNVNQDKDEQKNKHEECKAKVNDEDMDKTVVFFDLGDKEESESNVENESHAQNNNLKKFIEEKLNVKIDGGAASSNELLTESTNLLTISSSSSTTIIDQPAQQQQQQQQQQEPNVFERFLKSFQHSNNSQSEDDMKKSQKQNEENLNRIFELLNKSKKVEANNAGNESTNNADNISSSNGTMLVNNESSINTNDSSSLIKLLLKIEPKNDSNNKVNASDPLNKMLSLNEPQQQQSSKILTSPSSSIISPSSLSSAISSSKSSPNNNLLKQNTSNLNLSSNSSSNLPKKNESSPKENSNRQKIAAGNGCNNNNSNNKREKSIKKLGSSNNSQKSYSDQAVNKLKETKSSFSSSNKSTSKNGSRFPQSRKNQSNNNQWCNNNEPEQQIPKIVIQAPHQPQPQHQPHQDQRYLNSSGVSLNHQNKNHFVQYQLNQQQQQLLQQQSCVINKQLSNSMSSINSSIQFMKNMGFPNENSIYSSSTSSSSLSYHNQSQQHAAHQTTDTSKPIEPHNYPTNFPASNFHPKQKENDLKHHLTKPAKNQLNKNIDLPNAQWLLPSNPTTTTTTTNTYNTTEFTASANLPLLNLPLNDILNSNQNLFHKNSFNTTHTYLQETSHTTSRKSKQNNKNHSNQRHETITQINTTSQETYANNTKNVKINDFRFNNPIEPTQTYLTQSRVANTFNNNNNNLSNTEFADNNRNSGISLKNLKKANKGDVFDATTIPTLPSPNNTSNNSNNTRSSSSSTSSLNQKKKSYNKNNNNNKIKNL